MTAPGVKSEINNLRHSLRVERGLLVEVRQPVGHLTFAFRVSAGETLVLLPRAAPPTEGLIKFKRRKLNSKLYNNFTIPLEDTELSAWGRDLLLVKV